MPRGCSPGKLLQLPGAQVQAPRVGRFLQSALQTTVQGQVEARAAGASVMLVVLVEMRVQGGYREGGRESLGFASRRRHLPPVSRPAAPALGGGGESQVSPVAPSPRCASSQAAGRREGRQAAQRWRRRLSRYGFQPGSRGLRRRRRRAVSARARAPARRPSSAASWRSSPDAGWNWMRVLGDFH